MTSEPEDHRPFDLVLAASADSDYAWPAALSLLSAAARSTVRVICILVGDGHSDAFLEAARATFALHGIPFEHLAVDFDEFEGLPLGFHFSRAAYGRLCIPETAIQFAARTIYVDADTLTLGDLAALSKYELGDEHVLAAVRARGIPAVSSSGGVTDWEARSLSPEAPFFNSGVLVIQNDAWEKQEISRQVAEELARDPTAASFADRGRSTRYYTTVGSSFHGSGTTRCSETSRYGSARSRYRVVQLYACPLSRSSTTSKASNLGIRVTRRGTSAASIKPTGNTF